MKLLRGKALAKETYLFSVFEEIALRL